MSDKKMTATQLRKAIKNLTSSQNIYIFVAFLEIHTKITKKEAKELIRIYPGRTWEVDEKVHLYLEG